MVKKNEVRRLFETGAVKGYLPSDMAAMEIHINNMGNYTGAVFIDPIKKETGKPMPVLNLDALYESVKNSEDIIEAGVRSAGIVQDFLKNTYVPNIDFSRLPELMKDFDKISDRLYLSAVSPSYNNENTAMFEVQVMRFVPKMLLAQEGSDSMVAPLPRSAVKDMGLTEQEFFTKVSENTKNVLKPEIRNISDIFKNDTYSEIHGDLTIENIICTRNADGEDDFYIIDPNTGNVHDSSNLDYGKLLQSIHGGYEFLMATKNVSIERNRINFVFTKSEAYTYLYDMLDKYMREHFAKERVKSIYYHEIIHWLRLMPYKIEKNGKRVLLFYAGMLMVMNDVINNFEEEK